MGHKRCFKYQGLGHIVSNCPDHKVIALAKWKAIREDEKGEEKKEEEEVLPVDSKQEVRDEPNMGQMLLLRRNLSNLKKDEDEQRKNIFHSWCTI